MEAELANLLEDKETSVVTKLFLLPVLIKQVGEKYVPHAVDLIKSTPDINKTSWYGRCFNVGNRFFKYSQKNQDAIVNYGFTILEENAKPGSSTGYGIARQLGFFLKIPRRFSPDQKAPQYRGKNGLRESFYVETVTNAIDWRKKNRPRITTNR